MRASYQASISLSVIHALKPGQVVYDARLPGFGVRRQAKAVSYFVKLRVAGKQRWITLGVHGRVTPDGQVWTPDVARRQAIQVMANPTIASAPKTVVPTLPPDTTFATIAEAFLVNHGPKLKPQSLSNYSWLIRDYLNPAFGNIPIEQVTRSHISAAHATWKEAPRSANFALTVLSKLMTWCEDQGYRPEGSNPTRRVQRYRETVRERFLTPDEMARLGAALDLAAKNNLTSLYVIAALRLLILTGARLNEILTLEWSFVDLGRRLVFLPDSKTGKKPFVLNDAAIKVLKGIPRMTDNPYVIVGHITGRHLVNIQKPWRAIRAMAGLDNVRIHDLRHTFASFAVDSGASLPMIGRQLGHSQPTTTQRYAHLADDPVRRMTQVTGEKLDEAMRGTAAKPQETDPTAEATMLDLYADG
jgi:integrase